MSTALQILLLLGFWLGVALTAAGVTIPGVILMVIALLFAMTFGEWI